MKITHSVGGVVIKGNMILMTNQKGDSWSLPKGHIEAGENELQTAIREIYEETGVIDLQFIKKLGEYKRYRIGKGGVGEDKSELKVFTFFLFRTKQESLKPVDPDNPEARWVPKEKVVDFLTHPKDKEFYLNVLKEINL